MPHLHVNDPLHSFLRSMRAQHFRDEGDAELLDLFLKDRNEAAFEALVRRHGPMVLGVCRRMLKPHDVDDAFQATFLVLIRKAKSISPPRAVGNWLYGVACRVALRARSGRDKWNTGQGEALDMVADDAVNDDDWRELRPLLDEEINRLPEKYRSVLVLCYLQGKTNREAAKELGSREGSMSRRLTRAKELLRARLEARGITLTATALLTLLMTKFAASAAVPKQLLASTIKLAALLSAGEAAMAVVSTSVATLAKGALKTMAASKLKMIAAVTVTVGMLGGGAGVMTHQVLAQRQKNATPQANHALAPANHLNEQAVYSGRVLDPDGKPFAGAKIYLAYYRTGTKASTTHRAISDKNGKFNFEMAKSDFGQSYSPEPWKWASLFATADGYGPALRNSAGDGQPAEWELRLVNDVPINGRIIDLQGQPVASASIRVHSIKTCAQENLTPFIEAVTGKNHQGAYFVEPKHLPVIHNQLLAGVYPPTVTGPDGRFTLRNIGRERVVELIVGGPTIETRDFDVMTRVGVTPFRAPKSVGVPDLGMLMYHGPTFDEIVGPATPIEGVVRAKDTGKPLAGVTVRSDEFVGNPFTNVETVTDKDGRYRLGHGKSKKRTVTALPTEVPYLSAYKHIPAAAGVGRPITMDFDLTPGVWVDVRVTNKISGEPVQAGIEYVPFADNPNRKQITDFPGLVAFGVGSVWTDKNGCLRFAALPGRGIVGARSMQTDEFMTGVGIDKIKGADAMIVDAAPLVFSSQSFNTVAEINPAKDAKSVACDLPLHPGQWLRGTVSGPD